MEPLAVQARKMNELFEEAATLAKLEKATRALAKEAEAKLMERMEMEETDSITSGGKQYTKTTTNYGVVQDAVAFHEWAASHDERLLKTKPDGELLNQLVRERLDNGEALPPGVGFYPKEYISKTAR